MKNPSYYSLEELLVQRENCKAQGMNATGIEAEIALVVDYESVTQARQNHPSSRVFDQDVD